MRSVIAVIAFVACAHAGLWALARQEANAPDLDHQLASVSYAPFGGEVHPDSADAVSADRIRSDLRTLSPLTRAVRTYSATGGVELGPEIANEFGLKVSAGAWIDKFKERNERELRSVIELAKRHSNVTSIVVGNETIYRDDVTVPELIKMIQRVKRATGVPVTTGEIWNVWMEHPELVSAVDYIAVHILPYWEGFSEQQVVEQTLLIYDKLRQTYPGKRIVIAEFGWPSAGYNFQNANPGRIEQAKVIRDFVSRAYALGIDYNIVEAIDQPWKTNEGGVGPYWGLFDASRQPKFSWYGPITDPNYSKIAIIALLTGLLLSLPILAVAGASVMQATVLAAAANAVGAWFALVFGYWYAHYFVWGAVIALGVGIVLLIPLVVIALARVEEIAAIAFGRRPARLLNREPITLGAPPLAPESFAPKVSIHIPAYREPPEMLKQTLDAVARLNYPNFECLVIINNTPEPEFWQPIEEHCARLGDRFKFLRADKIEGFKAGALRLALEHTAPDAEIIGVIDADYAVTPDWLEDLVPVFADPRVGLVQAPQDHRDGARSLMHYAMNGEYAGFFDIGMVQRNEVNAIVTHGTMCLIRRAALEDAGSWSSDTICEDTDLGLTILELGWTQHYTQRRYGYGLLPDSFDAFKKQRHRWAYGGFQIVKKHWRRFLPGASRLTRDQKREFALGWLNWMGAESLGVVVALLNIVWVPVVAFLDIAVPDKILTIPIVATFLVSAVHFVALYRLRVGIRAGQLIGSLIAAMSMQWTIARAVGQGLIRDHLPFVRTAKGGVMGGVLGGAGGKLAAFGDFKAFWEAVIATLLIAGAVVLLTNNPKQVREINFFAVVLLVQSLPFIAATLLALVERTPLNDFATWRALEGRLAEAFSRRPAVAKQPSAVKRELVS
jgi:exo-beta-1,3-glucanase (GH17 family)/cellulose synthase/poly-beta-1,6-N-acetylglucosamine synthase-like glycosyltransferase